MSLNSSPGFTQMGITSSMSRMAPAAWLVTAVFMLSNSTTPLYVHWQAQMGFSSGTLTVVFAIYIAGLLGTLLVAGQLSDRYGRKPVLLPGLALALLACGLFASASSIFVLAVGRLFAGIAVGIIVSAGMAAVVDAGGTDNKRKAALLASIAMVLGAGIGPLVAGGVAQTMKQPVLPIFAAEAVVLISAMLAALRLPKPVGHKAEKLRLRLPHVPSGKPTPSAVRHRNVWAWHYRNLFRTCARPVSPVAAPGSSESTAGRRNGMRNVLHRSRRAACRQAMARAADFWR